MFLVLFCGFWTVDMASVTMSGSAVASRDLGTEAFLIKISGSEVAPSSVSRQEERQVP